LLQHETILAFKEILSKRLPCRMATVPRPLPAWKAGESPRF
jgi:hypothetical protein